MCMKRALVSFLVLGLFPLLSGNASATIINFGGFEHGDSTPSHGDSGIDIYDWNTESGSGALDQISIVTGTKHGGEYALEFDGTASADGEYARIAKPNRDALAAQDLWLTFYLYLHTPASTIGNVAGFAGDATFEIRVDDDNLYVGGATDSNPIALSTGTWHKIEVHANALTQNVALWVNDATTTSTTTAGGGSLGDLFDSVWLGELNDFTNGRFYLDDWVVSTTELNFNPQVVRLGANGDGDSIDWDATNGYEEVDDIPPDNDTTYIVSSTATNQQLVHLESTTNAGLEGIIQAVKTQALARDESAVSSLATLLRINGTNYNQTENVNVAASYSSIGSVLEQNPNTSADWTLSNLDALQIGVYNNASVATRVTAMHAMVLTALAPDPPAIAFAIQAVEASILTNGITTSVASTPTTLPFGNLTTGIPKYAAHKLTASTNASHGYTVSVKMVHYLQGDYPGNNIDPFIANWNQPTTWSQPTGTTPNVNTGWIGANTSDTRVANWDDAQALFGGITSSAQPVMHSPGIDAGSDVYVTYALEVNNKQPADLYSGTITYTIIPTY